MNKGIDFRSLRQITPPSSSYRTAALAPPHRPRLAQLTITITDGASTEPTTNRTRIGACNIPERAEQGQRSQSSNQ